MKTILLTTLLLSSFSLFAQGKFVCVESENENFIKNPRVIVLNPLEEELDSSEDQIDSTQAYSLDVYLETYWNTELSVKGTTLLADVWFEFTSDDGKVKFNLYLDEMDQAGLYIKGEKGSNFYCY